MLEVHWVRAVENRHFQAKSLGLRQARRHQGVKGDISDYMGPFFKAFWRLQKNCKTYCLILTARHRATKTAADPTYSIPLSHFKWTDILKLKMRRSSDSQPQFLQLCHTGIMCIDTTHNVKGLCQPLLESGTEVENSTPRPTRILQES